MTSAQVFQTITLDILLSSDHFKTVRHSQNYQLWRDKKDKYKLQNLQLLFYLVPQCFL